MKKLLSIVAALLICMGSQAQIVSSRSSLVKTERQPRQPRRTQWFVRTGMNVMKMSGDGAEGIKSNMGYNVMFGFDKSMGSAGAYWGMDFGLTSRGFKDEDGKGEDVKAIAHAVQVSPFTFGWKINVAPKLAIDPHIGTFVSFDYVNKYKGGNVDMNWDDFAYVIERETGYDCTYNLYDVGINTGVGIWYSRFNLDISYQRGFVDVFTEISGCKSSNLMIRLGVAF